MCIKYIFLQKNNILNYKICCLARAVEVSGRTVCALSSTTFFFFTFWTYKSYLFPAKVILFFILYNCYQNKLFSLLKFAIDIILNITPYRVVYSTITHTLQNIINETNKWDNFPNLISICLLNNSTETRRIFKLKLLDLSHRFKD